MIVRSQAGRLRPRLSVRHTRMMLGHFVIPQVNFVCIFVYFTSQSTTFQSCQDRA